MQILSMLCEAWLLFLSLFAVAQNRISWKRSAPSFQPSQKWMEGEEALQSNDTQHGSAIQSMDTCRQADTQGLQ